MVFIAGGVREEEAVLAGKGIEVSRSMGSGRYQRFRHLLARVGYLRSGYYLLLATKEAVMDSTERGRVELNRAFEPREDPWDYSMVSFQRDRMRGEVDMLDAVRGSGRFGKVFEVGCAEGIFTEMLAPRCDSLLAADISQVALTRARRRLEGRAGVHFAEWDLRLDPMPGAYDLVVIVHALEYIRNPFFVRRARTKVVNCLRPGGHLLVGAMKVAEIYESAWWGRYALRSGKQINNFFAAHPALKVVRTAEFYLGKDYVAYDVLLQKAS